MPDHSNFFFRPSQLDTETFQVVSFTGHEELSRLWQFELHLVSTDKEIDFADVVNQPAELVRLRLGEEVSQHGLVVHFEQSGQSADHAIYRAILAPRIWLLTLSHQSRVFQQLTVEDIIIEVLEEAGFTNQDYRFDLAGSYEPREYCVQYRETDLDFISRLMEFEGMYFFFDHEGDKEVLVIVDDLGKHDKIGDEASLDYHEETGQSDDTEYVNQFVCREQIVTGKVLLKDYNYETPETAVEGESSINTDMVGRYYDYGGDLKDSGRADQIAKVRNEEIECRRRVLRGSTVCRGFRVGYLFGLEGFYRPDVDRDYLITRVEHQGSQRRSLGVPGLAEDEEIPEGYRAFFVCIPSDVQYRPHRLTRVPQIPGILNARVETAGGDYAHIDDEGRYHVKMPFDLGDRGDGSASKALRLSQPYTGTGYGIHFPNHANTDMVWACVDGDVDRPIALGTAPNPTQKSPSLAENKMQNVIRTWGQNELTFDDTKGEENILLNATKDRTVTVANDENMHVGNNRTRNVGSMETVTVGTDQSVTIGTNRSTNVGANDNISVGASRVITVAQALATMVGAVSEEAVAVAKRVDVGGPLDMKAAMRISLDAGQEYSLKAGTDSTTQAGKDFVVQAGAKVAIDAKGPIMVSGHNMGVIDIQDQLQIKCGKASITMKKNGDIVLSGKKITIKGSGDIVMKGKKILGN